MMPVMDPKAMKMAMKKMGVKQEEIPASECSPRLPHAAPSSPQSEGQAGIVVSFQAGTVAVPQFPAHSAFQFSHHNPDSIVCRYWRRVDADNHGFRW